MTSNELITNWMSSFSLNDESTIMIAILTVVTLFIAALIVLDRLPARLLYEPIMIVRAHAKPSAFRLWVLIACPGFLVEWCINERDYHRNGRHDLSGILVLLHAENWWARKRGDEWRYKRTLVDSFNI